MDIVETKFFNKNHVLELNFKYEIMSKKWPQKPKYCHLNHIHIQNSVTLGKYLNYFFENLPQKLINFEAVFVGKVPKSSVFNQDCLETNDFFN